MPRVTTRSAAPAAPARARPSSPSVRALLMVLVLACVLPASLGAVVAIVAAYQEGRAGVREQALNTARTTMQRVDAELANAIAALQALATSPAIAAGDLAAFDAQARAALPLQAGNNLVLTDAAGRQQVNTLRPFGAPLPRHGDPVLQARVISRGQPEVSGLFVGGVTRRPLVAVEVPVRSGGRISHSLAMGFFPERIAELLASRSDPSWIVSVLDGKGTIVARTHGAERLVGTQGAPALLAALRGGAEGTLDIDTVDGVPVLATYSRSARTGWSVAVGVPRALLMADLQRWLALLLVATVALFAVGVIAAVLLAQRIAGAFQALLAPAAALGRGEPVTLPPLPLREADRVGVALTRASRLLRQRTHERDDAARRNEQLVRVAGHDALTGLANRAQFIERLTQRIEAQRALGGSLTVFFLDLDDFKPVNDRHGHAVGDDLLRAVATRLRSGLRGDDLAARLGGDEFAVLIDGLPPDATLGIAEAVIERLSRPYAIREQLLRVSACIGIAGYPADGQAADQLLEAADQAMYRAKAAGKGDFRTSGFTPL